MGSVTSGVLGRSLLADVTTECTRGFTGGVCRQCLLAGDLVVAYGAGSIWQRLLGAWLLLGLNVASENRVLH